MTKKSAIVIGAGPAGLGAAWQLLKEGIDVEVFEATAQIGGLSATINDQGYIFDQGIHGIYPSGKESEYVLGLIKNLCAEKLIQVHKKTSIYFRQQYLNYPLGLKEMFSALSPFTSFLCLLDFLFNRLKKAAGLSPKEKSFKNVITSNFGTLLYNRFFGPYAQKVWGIEPSLLNADDIMRRVTTVNVWDVIRKASRGRFLKEPERKQSYSQQPPVFYYGARGAGTVMETIASEINRLGGRVRTGSLVTRVNIEANKVQNILIQNQEGTSLEKTAAFFISTMPITSLVKAIHPRPPQKIIQDASLLQFRALIFVNLKVNKEMVSDNQWVYFSSQEFIFNRVNEFKNIKSDFSPNNKTGLTVEISCFVDDNIWNLSDREIYLKVISDFKKLGLINDSDVESYTIQRRQFIYPIPRIDTKESLHRLLSYLSTIKNLFLAGRESKFEYINMDESLHQGFTLAKNIKRTIA